MTPTILVYCRIDRAIASNGLTVWNGRYEKLAGRITSITSTKWFDRLEELQAAHPKFVDADIKDLGQMKWAWPLPHHSKAPL